MTYYPDRTPKSLFRSFLDWLWLLFLLATGAMILCLLADSAFSGEPYKLAHWKVKDGDTLHAETLYLPFGVALYDVDMRCADFDAWESSFRRTSVSITHEEIKRGQRAAKELAELLAENEFRVLPPNDSRVRDVYGRLLVVIEVKLPERGWVKLADWMKLHRHVREG